MYEYLCILLYDMLPKIFIRYILFCLLVGFLISTFLELHHMTFESFCFSDWKHRAVFHKSKEKFAGL